MAAAAPPAVAAHPEQPGAAVVGFSHVRDAWGAALAAANKVSKRIGAYLHSSRPASMEGDELVVEVQYGFHAQAMTEPSNKEVLSDALFAALGIRPQLRFVERGKEAVPSEPVQSGGSHDISEIEDAQPIEGGEHDPFELVKKGLGAEVVEERGAG